MVKDKEIFLPIPGYVGLYEVSNYGTVRSLDRQTKGKHDGFLAKRKGRTLKGAISKVGYMRYVIGVRGEGTVYIGVHRLVAMAFIPNPENKPTVNHKDGDKLNNYVGNLEWATVGENNRHARKAGLNVAKKGEECHSYGFKCQRALVLQNINTGEIKTITEVAKEYKCTGRHVTMMMKGERTNKTDYVWVERDGIEDIIREKIKSA